MGKCILCGTDCDDEQLFCDNEKKCRKHKSYFKEVQVRAHSVRLGRDEGGRYHLNYRVDRPYKYFVLEEHPTLLFSCDSSAKTIKQRNCIGRANRMRKSANFLDPIEYPYMYEIVGSCDKTQEQIEFNLRAHAAGMLSRVADDVLESEALWRKEQKDKKNG